MKIYITRHGETDWNAVGRVQGRIDTEINEVGRKQAQDLAAELKSIGIDRIVASTLKRSGQTAAIIADVLGVPIQNDERLRECAFGEFEGMLLSEREEKYGEKISGYFTDEAEPYSFSVCGGEDRESVLSRHVELLNDLKMGASIHF